MIDILDESGSSIDPEIGPIIVGAARVLFAGRTYINVSKQLLAAISNLNFVRPFRFHYKFGLNRLIVSI